MSDRAPAPAGTSLRSVDQLLDPLSSDAPSARTAEAAVLIVLKDSNPGVEILLIERADRPGDPAARQVGLPGGRVHPADRDLGETAARETEEEVGLTLEDFRLPPRYVATEYAPAFGLSVGVFATGLRPDRGRPTARDHHEVESVYWLPEAALARVSRVPRDTRWGRREVEASVHEGHVLWGFTLRVLREFFGLPGGSPPGPPPPR